jgi:hypothetical protein
MNDHHFSYPRVVPLPGASISGHAIEPPVRVVSLLAPPPVPQVTKAAPAPAVASLAA